MAITISGTNGIVGAGFTVDNSGVSVTAGVGTFSSLQGSGANLTALPAANLTGTLPAISGANLTGITAGITQADTWRISSDAAITSSQHTVLTSNWERPDTSGDGFNYLGTGFSAPSSGVFTFPSTGYWYVTFNMCWYANGSNAAENWIYIYVTEDNSSFVTASMQANSGDNGDVYGGNVSTIIDCTSTTNVKVRFQVYAGASNQVVVGNSTQSRTYAQFIRLGDT